MMMFMEGNTMAHASKIFDTSTVQGVRAAERFKARLNNTHDSVNVYTIGLYRVQIVGLSHVPTNHGQAPQFETTNQLAAVAAMTEKR